MYHNKSTVTLEQPPCHGVLLSIDTTCVIVVLTVACILTGSKLAFACSIVTAGKNRRHEVNLGPKVDAHGKLRFCVWCFDSDSTKAPCQGICSPSMDQLQKGLYPLSCSSESLRSQTHPF